MAKRAEHTSDKSEQQAPRFDQWQYDFLRQCSEKGEEGIKEWNEWRKQNPEDDIRLDGADLHGWYLAGVNLVHGGVFYMNTGEDIDYSGEVYLRKANLRDVSAERARFKGAHLQLP